MQVNKQSSHGSYGSHAVPLLVMYPYQCTPYGKSKNISPETSGYWWVEKSSQTTKSSMVMETFTNTFSMDPYWDQSVWFNSGILQKMPGQSIPNEKHAIGCTKLNKIPTIYQHLFPTKIFRVSLALDLLPKAEKVGLAMGILQVSLGRWWF